MRQLLLILITLLTSLLSQAQYSWQAEKVNEVSWFAPVAVFEYDEDIYVLGDNKTDTHYDSLLLYRFNNGSFQYEKSVFFRDPLISKLNIFSYNEGAALNQSSWPTDIKLLGEKHLYDYANDEYLIKDSTISNDGGITFSPSPVQEPFYINDEIIVGTAFSDSIFIYHIATKQIDTVLGYSIFNIDYLDDGLIVHDKGRSLWIKSKQNIAIEGDPFLLAKIDDFITINDKLYYHLGNHVYEYIKNEDDRIVYSFVNNNSLNDLNTRHHPQTFIQKDNYIYFYDSYKGLVRTEDFDSFEYLAAIDSKSELHLYNMGDNIMTFAEGQMWVGEEPDEMLPVEGATPDTKILYYDEEKVWFADYRKNYQGWAPGIYISKYKPEIDPDTLERYQYVYLFYTDSNYAIGQNRLYGAGFSILDFESDTFLPLVNSDEELIYIDPVSLPYNGSSIFYHDTLFLGNYHSVNEDYNEMKRIEAVYDINGTEINLGYNDVLRYEISNDSLFAYHRDSTWYIWGNGVFKEYSKTKGPLANEDYLIVNNLNPRSNADFVVKEDSISIDSDKFYPIAFPQIPQSLLKHKGEYYFSHQNEIYRLYLVPTSVEEAGNNSLAYPNPTTGSLSLEQRFDWVEVYSADGRLLRAFREAETINLSDLPKGAYYLKTKDDFCKIILE